MKKLLAVVMLISCATVNPYAYDEAPECPGTNMTPAQFDSGTVRCRALCSSWGRNLERYNAADCKCLCKANTPPVYGNQM